MFNLCNAAKTVKVTENVIFFEPNVQKLSSNKISNALYILYNLGIECKANKQV